MDIRKPDRTVPEMWIGEVAFGLLCEAVGLIFLKDKSGYTVGLTAGVVLAMAATYHMWWVLDTAVNLDEKSAGRMIGSRYVFRYLALIALLGVLYYAKLGNAFAAFLGYMSLKATAYLQPVTHKILDRITGSEEDTSENIQQEGGE